MVRSEKQSLRKPSQSPRPRGSGYEITLIRLFITTVHGPTKGRYTPDADLERRRDFSFLKSK